MSAATIRVFPRNFLHLATIGFDSPGWAKFHQDMWHDSFIDNMQFYRYTALRTAKFYRLNHMYWARLSYVDQALAEGQAEYWENLAHDLFAVEMMYKVDQNIDQLSAELDKLIDSPDASKTLMAHIQGYNAGHKTRAVIEDSNAAHGRTAFDSDWHRALLELGNASALMGVGSNQAQQLEAHLLNPISVKEPDWLVNRVTDNVTLAWQTHHREVVAAVQHDFYLSRISLIRQLDIAGEEHNELKGVAAKGRSLIIDNNIPVPNRYTLLAWFALMGVACRELKPIESIYVSRLCHFEPTHIATFGSPLMPRTKEHMNRGSIQTDDSHADTSLPSRSGGHRRTPNGAIDYGVGRLRTILFNATTGESHLVAEEADMHNLCEVAAIVHHETHLRMLPRMESTIQLYMRDAGLDVFVPYMHFGERKMIQGIAYEPFSANPQSMPFYWPFGGGGRFIDYGSRSLAKWNNIHMRFDSDEAVTRWMDAMQDQLIQYCNDSANDRLIVNINQCRALETDRPEKAEVIRRGNTEMKFKWDQ